MVPISPEIYSGAAVVMDNRSLFDYAQKIEERRAKKSLAEQEAIDKYVVEIGKNLTPTGMKVNDIPDYLKMQQELRELSDKYKSSRNPFDKLALNNKADEMFLFINESKGAVKEGEQPTSTLGDASKRNQVDFETLAKDLELHNLPLRDPNRKKIGALSNYFFPQQFNEVSVFNEASKGIKESEFGATIVKGEKFIPVRYGEDAIRSIAENYVKLVDIDPTGVNYYKGKLKNLPAEQIAEAVARVKKYYPTLDIDEDDPLVLKLSDAIKTAEGINYQKTQVAPTKVSVSTGGAAGGPLLDYYKQLVSAWKPFKVETQPYTFAGREGLPLNKIKNVELQSLLIKKAKELMPDEEFSQKNLYLKRFPDYSIHLINITKSKDIDLGEISEADVNIPLQPSSATRVQAGKSAEFPEMKSEKKENVINLADVPTGAKLTQKGNDYFYQGKKVIQ